MKKFLISVLKFYKYFISPVFEKTFGKACRFTPTCSEYTITALEKYGTVRGLTLGLTRLASCHPWGRSGYDPVPDFK
jgi:putative membrane protein insertion efficiency factor